VFFSFNLFINVISASWVCFYAIIMGTSITDEFFATAAAIWNNAARLHYLAKEEESRKFCEAIKHLSKYGFR